MALASWIVARRTGGAFVVRVEDLDRPRVVVGAASAIMEDLAWLGLSWDEGPSVDGTDETGAYGPYVQSACSARYDDALVRLAAAGHLYPCDCSRQEIARVASAPHDGEEVAYPGTCRDKAPDRSMKRPPALRFRVPAQGLPGFDDVLRGAVAPPSASGDFVVRRGDGVYAYQLAVAVDDAVMGIDVVLRGDDLLSSTPRQLAIVRALRSLGAPNLTEPRYGHLPMVVDDSGARLAKRAGAPAIAHLRRDGATAADVVGVLAHGLGIVADAAPISAADLVARPLEGGISSLPSLFPRRTPFAVPASWRGGGQ